jgi:integrase
MSYPRKRDSTVPDQARQLRWWKTRLGHYALADTTPALIAEYRDRLKRGRAGATAVRYLAVLSYAFTVAIREWQWCAGNPVLKITKLREPRGRVRFLSDQERHQLLGACQASRNHTWIPSWS